MTTHPSCLVIKWVITINQRDKQFLKFVVSLNKLWNGTTCSKCQICPDMMFVSSLAEWQFLCLFVYITVSSHSVSWCIMPLCVISDFPLSPTMLRHSPSNDTRIMAKLQMCLFRNTTTDVMTFYPYKATHCSAKKYSSNQVHSMQYLPLVSVIWVRSWSPMYTRGLVDCCVWTKLIALELVVPAKDCCYVGY